MKICSRCGRDLDKTQHSLTCPVGELIKQVDKGGGNESIRIAFPNDEMRVEFSDMMARTGQMMIAVKTFYDAVTELDENAPDVVYSVAPHLEKFTIDLMLIYPDRAQFEADLKTLLGQGGNG